MFSERLLFRPANCEFHPKILKKKLNQVNRAIQRDELTFLHSVPRILALKTVHVNTGTHAYLGHNPWHIW